VRYSFCSFINPPPIIVRDSQVETTYHRADAAMQKVVSPPLDAAAADLDPFCLIMSLNISTAANSVGNRETLRLNCLPRFRSAWAGRSNPGAYQ
jgi:hypothetical protein